MPTEFDIRGLARYYMRVPYSCALSLRRDVLLRGSAPQIYRHYQLSLSATLLAGKSEYSPRARTSLRAVPHPAPVGAR